MSIRIASMFLASVMLWSWQAPASVGDDFLRDGQLRVISYNVQFLPGIAAVANKRPNPVYRAQTIGQKLSVYDIVGLNELFEKKPRDLVIDEFKKAWGDKLNVLASPQVKPNRFTGGLAIISRLPFLETNVHTYTQSSSPEKYGLAADGYATKGVLHARIALSAKKSADESVDVFITHMEAREDAIRPSQYAEMAEFIAKHSSPTRPAILMGDFNTRGNEPQLKDPQSPYHLMTGKFQAARPESTLIDLWPKLGKGFGGTSEQEDEDGGSRIDYIFVLNPQNAGEQLQPEAVSVNRFLDPKVTALSDHSAVEAVFKWMPASK